ncbi:IclR family transcriptional regulator C-terminal domain-containing protein [Streptomyces sp. NPDC053431]|uniref:IclR family transcriptional regulator domain-containing protein n=1 Tax=Streptomyces sp. NPDC053431 TaxID=3365703 RepID=UPI0037D8F017
MSETHGVFRSVEDVLATASATTPRPRADAAASRARLLAAAGAAPPPDDTAEPRPGAVQPDAAPLYAALLDAAPLDAAPLDAAPLDAAPLDAALPDADDARRELEALCAAVVLARDAGARLAVFAEHAGADPEGALVFACVLHLTGDGEGATFWWQLAAGAEVALAASCLFLDHARRGEFHDAALWLRRLGGTEDRPPTATTARPADPGTPLTPGRATPPAAHRAPAIGTERGTPLVEGAAACAAPGDAAPLLTPRVRRVLAGAGRWVRRREHEDLGPVPTAGRALAKEVFAISHQHVPARPGAWMVPLPPTVRRPGETLAEGVPAPSGPAPARPGTPRELPPGRSAAFSALPMRHASLTALAQQTPAAPHVPDRWAAALRVLDVLHAVRAAQRPLSTGEIASAARLDRVLLGPLLGWLCRHLLLARLADGAFTVGPLFSPAPAGDPVLRHDALTRLLDDLRDTTGAAIYISRYTHGEVDVQHCADGPTTPAVVPYVDFKLAAHASAVGKSLMAQLDFAERMDHLARHRPVRLTQRTITNPAVLFRVLDGHGPQASQFDLLEYSDREVCAAVPLTLDAQPACVALSLPAQHFPRLVRAADVLSNRSGLLLLTLLAELPADAGPVPADRTHPAQAAPAPPAPALASGSPEGGLVVPSGILTPVPAGGIAAFPTGTW